MIIQFYYLVIFSLIAVSIFGGEVFKYPLTANWGYIVAVFVVVLFFIAGILFILDAVHSGRQAACVLKDKLNYILNIFI
jgi:hypothetical protein